VISQQFLQRASLRRDIVESFDVYPFALPAVRPMASIDFHPKLTVFVGENGSGKSTLLEAIAVSMGFNAEGGSKHFNFGTRASHSELHRYLRVAKGVKRPRTSYFLRAESFYNVATHIEDLDSVAGPGAPIGPAYGERRLHEQSHGESFMALVMNRFRNEGLYLLDEPEAALSPQRQLALMARMHDLIDGGSQFVIATHSPILMAYPDAWIYQFTREGIERVPYAETEHYLVTRRFMLDPQGMLDELLGR
jgi:predicted ATPase